MNIQVRMLSTLCACLLAAGCASQAVPVNQPQVAGVIRFAQKMDGPQQPGGRQCSVTVPAAGKDRIQFKMSGCGNDVATFVKFENVPSSTFVRLVSERSCEQGDWWFQVRAIKQPTTSLWFDIRDLKNPSNQTIIVPGVMKWSGYYSHGNIEGKLSCALIWPPQI